MGRWVAVLILTGAIGVRGAGVTIITHGFNANVTDWVIPMGDKIAQYRNFPGTNVASYQISVTRSGSVYNTSQAFLDGVSPLASDSGEIIIALDWSSLSSGAVPTTAIATQAVAAILSTTLIPDLNGRSLAELPLHFIGHSRGASVITEMARLLGAQGVWVDQVTTLDPHPTSLFGDPPMKNYENILFADNYWQNLGDNLFVPNGQAISGAYNRQLTSLNGGYSSTHSDVHLWYHGTVDLKTPITVDTAMITSTERAAWWTATEAAGTNGGVLYSLVGGGNRFSSLEPAGAGKGRIVDGYNKIWDLGAGLAAVPATNRATLPFDNGLWPNLLRMDLTGTTSVVMGASFPAGFYYQFGANTSAVAAVQFYLDRDSNPYNGNETMLYSTSLPGTGTNSVMHGVSTLTPNAGVTAPGSYRVFARISDGARTRYLYAPQKVLLTPNVQPLVLVGAMVVSNQLQFTVLGTPGQTVIVQGSTDLVSWVSLRTNVMPGETLPFADPDSSFIPGRFYRAVVRVP